MLFMDLIADSFFLSTLYRFLNLKEICQIDENKSISFCSIHSLFFSPFLREKRKEKGPNIVIQKVIFFEKVKS